MDSLFKIYLQRAQNELNLSGIIMQISDDKDMQVNIFRFQADTYYSAVISHAYYCIFYAAKAYLLTKDIRTKPPEEHKKTFEEFNRLADQGTIDAALLEIYEKMLVKASTLLHIFEVEKVKQGKFTYRTLPQANREPAEESIRNAQTFFRHICNLCEKKI